MLAYGVTNAPEENYFKLFKKSNNGDVLHVATAFTFSLHSTQ